MAEGYRSTFRIARHGVARERAMHNNDTKGEWRANSVIGELGEVITPRDRIRQQFRSA
jgi:hypothetical protein